MKTFASVLTFTLATSPAFAGDLITGLGVDDVFDQTDTETGALIIEYHADPFYSGQIASYSLAGAGQIDGDGDVFIGVGVSAIWSIGQGPWFVEGSFMPGYYDAGSGGSELGGNLQFRSLIGVGYKLANNSRISIAIDHKSNADIEDINPGSETLAVRYSFDF
ncbi:hypothetical protein So717_08020 [Roseobacter cerasinus]|uniref:Lipid A 3-O-deacylase (PagL) n=1 Tax=Roseobacter cerasinus TaxID=2602289 RepID=A0A640VLT1_9RHOB|nr:hypothetical protein So717_08020 [Roseobacter cerasinus]